MNFDKELIKALNRNTYVNVMMLNAMYRKEQLKESDKVPPTWRPYTVLIPGLVTGQDNPMPINVFPRNPKRSGFTILNSGTSPNNGSVIFGTEAFDLNEINAQIAGQGQGVIGAAILNNNQQISIPSSGPLYVAPTSSTATSLTIIETLFFDQTKDTSLDGVMHGGYRGRDGTIIDDAYQNLQKDLV